MEDDLSMSQIGLKKHYEARQKERSPVECVVIKPCPFCGGDKIDFFKGEFVDSVHTIECMECWAQMSKNSELEALEAWNRRAS